MRLQTKLTEAEIRACLDRAKQAGTVADDVVFDILSTAEIHLAAADRDSLPDGKRPASTMAGRTGVKYAVSYDEWGYVLAELFAADPDAKASPYRGRKDFHARTAYLFAGLDDLPKTT